MEILKNKTLLIDFQCFANVNYYKSVLNSTNIILEQYEYFRKMSFHNRYTIAGANGPINLSVPVDGGRIQHAIFIEVKISNTENWQRAHWRSILSSYNRSPWFEYYHDELADLYKTPFTFLKDWNEACLNWTLKCLKTELNISYSTEYKSSFENSGIEDLRGKITPRNPDYPRAENEQNGLKYQQVFEERTGFIPHLSIIDLLFCEGGKKAVSLLRGD